jgi:hypothetical protein
MNRFVFYFTDSDVAETGVKAPDTVYFFDLMNADGLTFHEGTPEGDDVIDFASEHTEPEFGVHDWTTTCNDKTDYFERVGYSSYEVPSERWHELIQKWWDFFQGRGYQPAGIQCMTTKDYYAKFLPWATYEEDPE